MRDQSYSQIFKSTSLFGGVQVFTIIISIIKSKLIAILLGPMGIGIAGLLNSTLSLITSFTNFSLERSAVKNIAVSYSSSDLNKISAVVYILKKLVWITGLLGSLLTFIFSSYLSKLTFENTDYSIAFKFLSITILFNQISSGQLAVLRGMHKLSYMAKASLYGAISGLIFSIPLYYFLGIKGITPAIIVASFFSLIISMFFSKKVYLKSTKVTPEHFLKEGKEMLSVGIILSLSTLANIITSYILKIYIRSAGSISDVGLYDAGFIIVNSYFGILFTALTTDYYPRLAGIANDNKKASILMNQQSEMSLLLLSPILVFFLIFANPIILLLYSSQFININYMILWAALGIFLKAASWSLGIIFISKGDVKTLLITELLSNTVILGSGILCYKTWGIEGLGISFLISFLYTFIQIFLIVKRKYNFSFTSDYYRIFFSQFSIGLLAFMVSRYNQSRAVLYLTGTFFIIVSTLISIIFLNQRINIVEIIRKVLKK
jgi:O-antigen/teichoic acid export membrane protein